MEASLLLGHVGPSNRHGSPALLPWHREFINRYEVLLQEADPTVKLLYWDWTTDLENATGGLNFFTLYDAQLFRLTALSIGKSNG